MKKSFFAVIFLALISTNIFALTFDISGVLSYKYNSVFGKTVDLGNNNSISYNSNINTLGLCFGLDLLFSEKFGLYTRIGFFSVGDVNRKVGAYDYNFKGSNTDYGLLYNIGVVFCWPIFNQYFSFCLSPSFTMDYLDINIKDYRNLRAAIDSVLTYGVCADVYFKFKYKHFMALAGCALSYMPFALVTSKDTAFNYSFDIKDPAAYSVRPYIGAGVTL